MSEIAKIRQRIDQEIAAMRQGFNGYAAVAKHQKVDRTYDNIGLFLDNMTPHVGRDTAMMAMLEELERG